MGGGEPGMGPDNACGPSRSLANPVLRRYSVEVDYSPPMEGASIASRIRNSTRLIWCESPGSITMEIQDVPAIVEAAHRRGVIVAIDNTWSAGVFFDAFRHRADISAQAVTKNISG